MGLSSTIAAGPRQRSHSQVRVPRQTWPNFTVSDSRLPQPGGPCSRIYLYPKGTGWPGYAPGTGFAHSLMSQSHFTVTKTTLSFMNYYITYVHATYWVRKSVAMVIQNIVMTITHSWSWALLEKLPIVQLLENFPAFYGSRRFITAFT
jgi:hypothetical protein